MKVIVCFKVIPDYDKVLQSDWKRYSFSYAKKSFGVFCEGALESALKIKDGIKDTYLEAVTYGENNNVLTQNLYAAGFSKVTLLKGRQDDFSSKSTALVLSRYIKKGNFDLVVCGEMVGPNDTGSVPYHLASYLNMKVIPDVTEFRVDDDVVIVSDDDSRTSEYILKEPVLAVVSDAKNAYLRFSSLKRRREAEKMKQNTVFVLPDLRSHKLKEKTVKKKEVKHIDAEELVNILRRYQND